MTRDVRLAYNTCWRATEPVRLGGASSPRTRGFGVMVFAMLCLEPLAWPADHPAAPAAGLQGGVESFTDKFAANRDAVAAWRVYTGADGSSHLEKVSFVASRVPFFGPNKGAFKVGSLQVDKESKVYLPSKLARVMIYSAPGNLSLPDHVSPGSEMFLMLRGTVTLVLRDGTAHEFGPGDLVIFEDTTGPGHGSRIGPEGFTAINFSFVVESPVGTVATRP